MEEIGGFLECGSGTLFWDHPFGGCEFSGRVFDNRGCLLLVISSIRLRVWCGFELRFVRPVHLLGVCQFRLLRSFCDWLNRGIWIRC